METGSGFTGIIEEGLGGLNDTALIISGYQGGSSVGDAILEAVAKARAANPKVLYSCDPLLGKATSGCFVSPEVQELTTASVYELLENTLASGQRELQLVESQQAYVEPKHHFEAVAIDC